jgi:hypothetical protein
MKMAIHYIKSQSKYMDKSYYKYLKYKNKYYKLITQLEQEGGFSVEDLEREKNKLKKTYKDDMWYNENKPKDYVIPPAPPMPPTITKKTTSTIGTSTDPIKKNISIQTEETEEKKKDTIRYILKPYIYIPPYRKKIYYDFRDIDDYELEYQLDRDIKRARKTRKTSKRKTSKRKTNKRKTSKRKTTKRKTTKRKTSKRKTTKRK